ncbi:hypothetical protein HYT33_01970, partial [Candidatus Roizmanbacteria bacterium]|nr:hypothetical protein [Candidatus Roizmanbacteria bacterium]
MKKLTVPKLVMLFIAGFLLFLIAKVFLFGQYKLPKGGETKKTTIQTAQGKREVMVTDGVKHSISLSEIVSGGPPKDGIPPIDKPKFVSVAEASKS